MINPTTKQAFLLKMTLAIIIGNDAGQALANRTSFTGRWDGAFINTFFTLICIVIVQWILLSDNLPKWWIMTGLVGCIISASIMGIINLYVSEQIFRLIVRELNVFTALLTGTLVALPQWFLLKSKKGYLWVLANGVGWLLSITYRTFFIYPLVKEATFLSFIRTLILETSFIPLGLLISLYLYSYVYNLPNKETTYAY